MIRRALFALLLTACGSEESPGPQPGDPDAGDPGAPDAGDPGAPDGGVFDPTGDYTLTIRYTVGSCGYETDEEGFFGFSLYLIDGEYDAVVAQYDAQTDDTVAVDYPTFAARFLRVIPDPVHGGELTSDWIFDLSFTDTEHLTGEGSIEYQSPEDPDASDCVHDFTVTGELARP